MITCTFEKGYTASLRHVVVHAIVEDRGKLLLVRRSNALVEGGKLAFPGGFLNRDETAAQGVLRELREETGWEGAVVSLLRINSNPERPGEDRQNVVLEYIISPIRQSGKPDGESTEVLWMPFEELSGKTFAFDHKETIELYRTYRNAPFPLPIMV
ncbi:NUDIX hydrolase [Patescibacteria group bacterium]|nr:NUDIX hydrolase [Patescibacteria group bacterium]